MPLRVAVARWDGRTLYEEFASVRDYEDSPHWGFTRWRYRSAHPDACCFMCGRTDYDLHHRTYERAGIEEFDDLVPLCEDHHHEVEKLIRRGDGPARTDAHLAYRADYDARANRPTSEGPR